MGDLLVRGAALHPERDCLVVAPAARRTYRELLDAATERACALLALGVRPGEHVGLLMSNSAELVQLLFSITFLGAVAVPLNNRLTPRELAYAFCDAELRVLFVGGAADDPNDYAAIVGEALAAGDGPPPTLRTVVAVGTAAGDGMVDAEAFAAMADPSLVPAVDARRSRVALRQPAVVFYTSGTTAMPKGCVLTHEALVRTGTVSGRARMQLREGACVWDPLPMFHTGFTQGFVAALDAGGTFLTMERFEAGMALDQIEAEGATAMFPAFPTITMALLDAPSYTPGRLRTVETIFNVAPPDQLRLMQDRLPHSVQISGFGLSEFGGSVVMGSRDEDLETRLADQGLPLPGMEVEIRDPATDEVARPGVRGEIVVRGPQAFEGYWRDPDKTARTIEADGWVHTGDLGTLTDRGGLRFEGRLKDMLKVGGENVAAIEIESYLVTHPSISIAVVVGVPDPRYEEVPAAFVQLRPGSSVDAEELLAYCRKGLARFKVPRHVRFVDEWPMSSTKVKKFVLRDALCVELDAAGTAPPAIP